MNICDTCLSFLKRTFKAFRLVLIGRFVFFALLTIQCGFLAAYPASYKDDVRLIPVFLLYVPTLAYWIYCLINDAGLLGMFYTWGLYVLTALIPNIVIIFALVGDDLDKKQLLGPNTLKVILCITPMLFLFLLNTASDLTEHEEYRQLASRLSIQITIDLFDAVEMLHTVLDERQNRHGIPKAFGRLMVLMACFSFLLSLLQLAENKLRFGRQKLRQKKAVVRNVMQMLFVNLVFLIIRLVVFLKYKKDESIFISKNVIAIFLSALEIYWIKK